MNGAGAEDTRSISQVETISQAEQDKQQRREVAATFRSKLFNPYIPFKDQGPNAKYEEVAKVKPDGTLDKRTDGYPLLLTTTIGEFEQTPEDVFKVLKLIGEEHPDLLIRSEYRQEEAIFRYTVRRKY